MARFIRSGKVRFEDCDLAGIVFYPNYFLMLTRLIEDWFAEALGVPWGTMHHERKLAFPTVSMQITFRKASRLDEVLEWSLEVRRLGSRSLTLGVSACCQGEERIIIETTLVSAHLVQEGVVACNIPADIRAGMKTYLGGQDAGSLEKL